MRRTLRTWVCAGAPIPRVLVQRAKAEMNLDVLSSWGMTENAGITITRKSDPQEKVFETDGRALPGNEVRVVDDDKRPLPPDTVGNLQARGITHFVGYLKKPQLNSIDADGWFDTGDLARMDARRLHPHRRPHQGRHHPRRREHSGGGGGGPDLPASASGRMRRGRPCPTRGSASGPAPSSSPRNAPLDLAELTRFLGQAGHGQDLLARAAGAGGEMPRTPSGKIQKFKLREKAAKLTA